MNSSSLAGMRPLIATLAVTAKRSPPPRSEASCCSSEKRRAWTVTTRPSSPTTRFHNIGVPQVGLNVPSTDVGRFGGIPSLLSHEFNTSSEFNGR